MEDMLKKYWDVLVKPAYLCMLKWVAVERIESETGQRLPDSDPRVKEAQAPVLGLQQMYRDWDFEGAEDSDKGAFAGMLNRAYFAGDVLYEEGEDGKRTDVSWRIIKTLVGHDQLALLNALRDLGNFAGIKVADLSLTETTKVCWAAIEKFRLPAEAIVEEVEDEEAADDTDPEVKASRFFARMTQSTATKRAFEPHLAQRRNFAIVLKWIERKKGEDAAELREEFEATKHPKGGKKSRKEAKSRGHKPTSVPTTTPTLAEQIAALKTAIDNAYNERRGSDAVNLEVQLVELEAKQAEAEVKAKAEQAAEAARVAEVKAQAKGPSIEEQIAAKQADINAAYAAKNGKLAVQLEGELEALQAKVEEESKAKGPSIEEQIAAKQADINAAYAAKNGKLAVQLEGELEALKAQAPATAPAPKAEAAQKPTVTRNTAPAPAAAPAPSSASKTMAEKEARELLAHLDDAAIKALYAQVVALAESNPTSKAVGIVAARRKGSYADDRFAVIRAVAGGLPIQLPAASDTTA